MYWYNCCISPYIRTQFRQQLTPSIGILFMFQNYLPVSGTLGIYIRHNFSCVRGGSCYETNELHSCLLGQDMNLCQWVSYSFYAENNWQQHMTCNSLKVRCSMLQGISSWSLQLCRFPYGNLKLCSITSFSPIWVTACKLYLIINIAEIILTTCYLRRVWRYQRGNQNPHIEEEQTKQWPKENVQKNKQRFTRHTHKTME